MTIIWCMVPEKLSTTDRIFFGILDHFFPIYPSNNPKNQNFEKNEKIAWRYYHFTQVYHKWQSYDVWFMIYKAWQIEFSVIFDHFLPFPPLTTWKIKILKYWKKLLEISSFYTSVQKIKMIKNKEKKQKNKKNAWRYHNHMLYCSWDMARDRPNCYFSFCAIFCPFTPLNSSKNQN